MSVKNKLVEELKRIVKDLGGDFLASVEIPADLGHGDFTTNAAMILGKKLKQEPMKIAEEIKEKFSIFNSKFLIKFQSPNSKESYLIFEKIEVVKPGFVNFWLSEEFLQNQLEVLNNVKSQFDIMTNLFTNKKVVVEFTDPNPFKEFHIGHLYSNTVGESISRILEFVGADVRRVDYFGDVGMHVAKSIWGMEQKLQEDHLTTFQLSEKPLKERINYIGQAYAKGATAYEENEVSKQAIININRLIYIAAQKMWLKEKNLKPEVDYQQENHIEQSELDKIYELYIAGRKWSLEYFEIIYQRLGTKFDAYYPESIAGERGLRLVKENIKNGIFVESDKAIVFKGEEFGLHTRVFINQLGFPTYEAKELGLAPWKYEEFTYDISIIVTGNEINAYFKVLLAAMSKINPDLAAKTKHISHGMVRLPSGKMSSRTGDVITGESLLDEACRKAEEKIQEVEKKEINGDSVDSEIIEKVGIGAVKYALLKGNIGGDIVFNFDESISFDGNSGPYIQYAYVRIYSVLDKFKILNPKLQINSKFKIINSKLEKEEVELLRLLARFGDLVVDAAEKYAPNMVCNYLFVLAQAFNLFYQKLPILKAEGETRDLRLALTEASGEVLKSGLKLLGIEAPERM